MTGEYVPQWGYVGGQPAVVFGLITWGAKYSCCVWTRGWLSVLLCSRVRARERHCVRVPVGGLPVKGLPGALGVNIYALIASHPPSHPPLMIRIRISIRVSRLARQYHSQAPSQRFNILYFGRDEFSCQVLEKLYTATGSTFPLSRGPRTRTDASSPADVWQNLLIATQPDQMIGRKRDILSVRQSPHSPTFSPFCVFLIQARC